MKDLEKEKQQALGLATFFIVAGIGYYFGGVAGMFIGLGVIFAISFLLLQ